MCLSPKRVSEFNHRGTFLCHSLVTSLERKEAVPTECCARRTFGALLSDGALTGEISFCGGVLKETGMSRGSLNILLVGAGAVGQAYGFHLQRAGHQVTFAVKPHYVDALAAGLDVRCLNGSQEGAHTFSDFNCLSLSEISGSHWDQVWLCMSSPALRSGFLEALVGSVGDAAVVMLQPGLDDRDYVLRWVPEERLCCGLIGLVSYPGPLGASEGTKTMTWWFPPFGPSRFSGADSIVRTVVKSLRQGGCPARRVNDVRAFGALGSGVLMPVVAGLELAGWSFKTMVASGGLVRVCGAAREATQLAAPGRSRVLVSLITTPFILRSVLRVARWAAPFDLEAMLALHFTKVGDQTREMLERYLRLAAETDQSAEHIRSLRDGLGGSPAEG